jgi:HD-like signal output (HDOD) protein
MVPVVLLSNVAEKLVILQAAKLGAYGYVLKSAFSLDDLLRRIERLGCPPTADASLTKSNAPNPAPKIAQPAAPAVQLLKPPPPETALWPRLLTPEQTLARIEDVASGKTIAGVVYQLISVANSPDSDLSDVVCVIQSDPMLAARVLQLANGASAGSRGRVRNIEDAARNLGVRVIQNMAISIGIVEKFPPDEQDGYNIMRSWQHSYAVADLLASLLGSHNTQKHGISHLLGLCHELGEILLRQYFVSEYEKIIAFASAHAIPVHQVQSVALGIRLPELISRLLTRIGLPLPIVQVIREFTEWQTKPPTAGPSPSVLALSLANLGAHGMLLSPSTSEMVRPITVMEWHQCTNNTPVLKIDPASKRSEVLTATNILARLPVKEEQRFLLPIIPRREVRIWYVRPESFVEFDPLAFALTLTCVLTISQQLPQGNQWHEIDGIVLVGARIGIAPLVPQELLRAKEDATRSELPILALSSQSMTPEIIQLITLRPYPISLEDLTHWLSRIQMR